METNSMGQFERPTVRQFQRKLLQLTVAGGLTFWATTIAISLLPIATEYRTALGFSHLSVLIESFIMGMIIAGLVSYGLLRFFDRTPAKNPILKAELLSGIVLVIALVTVQGTAALAKPVDGLHLFLLGGLLDVPRFLLLGLAIGYLCRRHV